VETWIANEPWFQLSNEAGIQLNLNQYQSPEKIKIRCSINRIHDQNWTPGPLEIDGKIIFARAAGKSERARPVNTQGKEPVIP
jgi:hypothetical protein